MNSLERFIQDKRLVNDYDLVEIKFNKELDNADTLEKQLQAYAAQVGRLEAILDTLKISIEGVK